MTIEEVVAVVEAAGLAGVLIRSSNVVFGCPFAAVSGHRDAVDSHPSLGILPVDGEEGAVWNCFTCGRKGTMRSFLDRLEKELGFDVDRAKALLEAALKQDPAAAAASIPEWESHFRPNPRRQYPVFPESWLDPYRGKCHLSIFRRGLEKETLKRYEVGYDSEAMRVIYPVRDFGGNLVGAVGGAVVRKEGQPKYKNYWHRIHAKCGMPLDHRDGKYVCRKCGGPAAAADVREGFRKSNFVYGEWLAGEGAEVTPVVVEGIVDCMKVAQALPPGSEFFPVALFGSKASDEQIDRIVGMSGGGVVAFFDNDPAGRDGDNDFMSRVAGRAACFRAAYPQDRKGADPGALEKEEILAALMGMKLVLRRHAP